MIKIFISLMVCTILAMDHSIAQTTGTEKSDTIVQISTADYSGNVETPDSIFLLINQPAPRSVFRRSFDYNYAKAVKNRYEAQNDQRLPNSGEKSSPFANDIEIVDHVAGVEHHLEKNMHVDVVEYNSAERLYAKANYIKDISAPVNLPNDLSSTHIGRRTKSFLPSAYNLAEFVCYRGDQGLIWSCTAWAIAAMKSMDDCITLRRTSSAPVKAGEESFFSPRYIYEKTKRRLNQNLDDCKWGIGIEDGLFTLQQDGIPKLQDCPYYKPSSVCPPMDLTNPDSKAVDHKVLQTGAVDLDVLSFQDALNHNYTIVFEARVDNSFLSDGKKDKNFTWASYKSKNSDQRVKHAMLCIGYNDYDGTFLVLNSLGEGFGNRGIFKITYEQMFNATRKAFRIVSKEYEIVGRIKQKEIEKINRESSKIYFAQNFTLNKDEKNPIVDNISIKLTKIEKINGSDLIAHLTVYTGDKVERLDIPIAEGFCKYFNRAKDNHTYFIQVESVTETSTRRTFGSQPPHVVIKFIKKAIR